MIRAIKSIDWRSLRVRLLTVTGVAMTLCFGVWCWQGWHNDTRNELAATSAKLEAVAATSGIALDGDLHQGLEPQMPSQPRAASVPEDYVVLQETLALIAERNALEGEVVTLVVTDEGLAAIQADRESIHPGALDLFVTSEAHPRWRETVDYVPAMAPALFEGRASSARTQNGALAGYAPVFDSFGAVAGIVRAQVPWSSSLL